jgi:hypothetical protein
MKTHFLRIAHPVCAKTRRDGERLLIQFLENYLDISFQGVQPGYGRCDALLLFAGGRDLRGQPSTLAVPVSILLLPHHEAKEICQNKIKSSQAAFEKGVNGRVQFVNELQPGEI